MNGKFHFCDLVKVSIDLDNLPIDIVKTNTRECRNSVKFNEFWNLVEILNDSVPSNWITLLFKGDTISKLDYVFLEIGTSARIVLLP